jgi:formate--tetrahydrofolate ligase
MNHMPTDIEIAQQAACQPIERIAERVGLGRDDLNLYGRYMAKVPLSVLKRFDERPDGKLIMVTAITATPAGEGKTVTSIGLVQALGKLGLKVMGAERQPSLGPVFGMKGGATGGGLSQVYPMWDIDIHFTGDIHAVGAAHNLMSSMLENHIQKKNELQIDPTRIVLRKAIDINCRELRNIVVGLGGRNEGGIPHESGFIITAASEISAILALATSREDLKRRLGEMIVAYTYDKKPVTAAQLKCVGALTLLLKDAIYPNLVQTLEGEPMFIHGFPFANIAHGSNSILATKYALKMADYVVTECGFATELGAEKFFDIVCRESGFRPDCAVIVASVRALKMHGGCLLEQCEGRNIDALQKGFENLDKHIDNVRKFGVPAVVAINHFPTDQDDEVELVKEHCRKMGVRSAISWVYTEGGEGGIALAQQVLEVLEHEKSNFHFLYDPQLPIKDKIRRIATELYGARDVQYLGTADRDIEAIVASGHDKLPICIAKTQHSITDDPKVKGAPKGWVLSVREVYASAGAGFIVAVCGQMMLIPGLPSHPSAEDMDIDEGGTIVGLS